MSRTPNFDDLKEDCNSNRLEHCFCYSFMQELAENESFVALLVEECELVSSRMEKHRELLQEGQTFSPFDPVSSNGLQCVRNTFIPLKTRSPQVLFSIL